MQRINFQLLLLSSLFLTAQSLFADECTVYWQHDLYTGREGPKAFNGDTNAAYAAFSYNNDKRTAFRLKGSFVNTRFFSVESYRSNKNSDFDSLMDKEIVADEGSLNPYVANNPWGAPNRNYTIEVIPSKAKSTHLNTLRIDDTADQGSIWLRYYAPNRGIEITTADLPTIEAYDPFTGLSKECPEGFDIPYFTGYPQILTRIVPRKKDFDFEVKDVGLAGNNAIPGYSYGVAKMAKGEVMVVKFKAPSFSNTYNLTSNDRLPEANVRYWSLCSQDVAGNVGLGCLADYISFVGSDGYVTAVISSSTKVRNRAVALGLNFIPDLRRGKQSILLMAYRNILPTPEFRPSVYTGEFNPKAKVCNEAEYLAGSCDFE